MQCFYASFKPTGVTQVASRYSRWYGRGYFDDWGFWHAQGPHSPFRYIAVFTLRFPISYWPCSYIFVIDRRILDILRGRIYREKQSSTSTWTYNPRYGHAASSGTEKSDIGMLIWLVWVWLRFNDPWNQDNLFASLMYGAIWFWQLILRWSVGELITLEIKTISMRSKQSTCDVEVSGCMVRPILRRYLMTFTCGYNEMTAAMAYRYFNDRYCGHPL